MEARSLRFLDSEFNMLLYEDQDSDFNSLLLSKLELDEGEGEGEGEGGELNLKEELELGEVETTEVKKKKEKKKKKEVHDWFSHHSTSLKPYETPSVLVVRLSNPAAMIYQIDGFNAPPKTVDCFNNYNPRDQVVVLGSWNGLIALYRHPGFFHIFNPNIKHSISLELPKRICAYMDNVLVDGLFGLCYDRYKDEYKGVIVDRREYLTQLVVYVVSFNKSTWCCNPEIGFPYLNDSGCIARTGTIVEGVPYWVANTFMESLVMKFDSEKNRLQILPGLPKRKRSWKLGTLSGQLTATVYNNEVTEIWAINHMFYNEDNITEFDWSPCDWIPILVIPENICNSSTLSWMIKDVEVLVISPSGKLMVFDVRERRMRILSLKLQGNMKKKKFLAYATIPYTPTKNRVQGGGRGGSGGGRVGVRGGEKRNLFKSLFYKEDILSSSSTNQNALKIGAIYSGEHDSINFQFIIGIWDCLKMHANGSTLYIFKNGLVGLMNSEYEKLDPSQEYPRRHQGTGSHIGEFRTPEQFQKAEKTVRDLDLDGLVVIGGNEAILNAYVLDEHLRKNTVRTCVICCPNIIHFDSYYYSGQELTTEVMLGCEEYSKIIKDIMNDARSGEDCYHFVRLTGSTASHIILECAKQTHPNIALVGEELFAKKLTLKDVINRIVEVICERSKRGYNYGVILIPEGLLYYIREFRKLCREIYKISFDDDIEHVGGWMEKLTNQSREFINVLPLKIRKALLILNNSRGDGQTPGIDTVWVLTQLVKTELEKRKKEGLYEGDFKELPHYPGLLKRDIVYTCCYEMGYDAVKGIHSQSRESRENAQLMLRRMGLDPRRSNLSEHVIFKKRNGEEKPVILDHKVELDGFPYMIFEANRDLWAIEE